MVSNAFPVPPSLLILMSISAATSFSETPSDIIDGSSFATVEVILHAFSMALISFPSLIETVLPMASATLTISMSSFIFFRKETPEYTADDALIPIFLVSLSSSFTIEEHSSRVL